MEKHIRLEKAINGLQKIVVRENKQEDFQVSQNQIIINNKPQKVIFRLISGILLLIPVGLLIYYLITNSKSAEPLLLLLIEGFLAYAFYQIILGDNCVTIDFQSKSLYIENNSSKLRKWLTSKTIRFSELAEVSLQEKSISKANKVLRLAIRETNKREVILMDFDDVYPESFIAGKVKFLIEVIIWSQGKGN